MVRVKPHTSFPEVEKPLDPDKRVRNQFRHFFTCYAKSIIIQENRTGSLFQKNFKRIEVHREAYFSRLVYYIHANPQLHGIIDDFREYPWSSYGRILLEKPSKLFKEEVISWFGGKTEYVNFHSSFASNESLEELVIEE